MRSIVVAVLGLALLGGCSSSDKAKPAPDTLTCDWLAGPNCYRTMLAETDACLPPSGEQGILSADGATCTYASGTVIAFAQPLTLPLADTGVDWDFTISSGGQTCLHYSLSQNSPTLTVGSDTYREALSGLGASVTCPDASQYSTSNSLSELGCGVGALNEAAVQSTSSSVSFSLVGFSSADNRLLFSCQR